MNDILAEMEGVLCHMDDVLIFGCTEAEHDVRLNEVLRRVEAAGATLNKEKCSFGLERLKFLGHIIDKDGISADPEKVAAITQMKQPANVPELRRFMGMTNQLGKFSPRIAELTQPLRELLSKKNSWIWGPVQDSAFSAIKTELSKPTVLGLYDPEANTMISADASSYGLGAVLLQQNKQNIWKPIAYASRSMTETERQYAQIEKEALATTWACEKFTTYVLGKQIVIQTDHKPLVPLFSTKNLDNLPPRILRFRLRLNRFDFTICHVPGKELYTADTLSRAPIAPPGDRSIAFYKELESALDIIISSLPASQHRLQEYRNAQAQDPVCTQINRYCRDGWPSRSQTPSDIRPYRQARNKLSVVKDLLLYGSRIVIPSLLQSETLRKIHQGHQGIQSKYVCVVV